MLNKFEGGLPAGVVLNVSPDDRGGCGVVVPLADLLPPPRFWKRLPLGADEVGVPTPPPALPVLKMLRVAFCGFEVGKSDDDAAPELDGVFALPPKSLPVEPEVVLLGMDPKSPPALGAEVLAVLPPTAPRLHEEPPEVVGAFDPKPPFGAPEAPPNRDVVDPEGALPDEVVAGGVPAVFELPPAKLNPEGLAPALAKGFGVLLPLPVLLPNKPPPPLLLAAPNGFEEVPAVVLPSKPLAPPAFEVEVFPNKLPPPDVLFGAAEDCPPLVPPPVPKLNLFAMSPKRSANVRPVPPVSSSSFRTCVFASPQSLRDRFRASLSESGTTMVSSPGVLNLRVSRALGGFCRLLDGWVLGVC